MVDPISVANERFCATLIEQFAQLGVDHAVVCPGSRSTPLALAALNNNRIDVDVVLDERAGGFVAVGSALASGRPSIIITTSGTAATELHPAVAEAHHGQVPLIALTADRPPELQGVGAPQTIDQRHLFGPASRCFESISPIHEVPIEFAQQHAIALWMAAMGMTPGPVQCNLGISEPLLSGTDAAPLPAAEAPGPRPLMRLLDEQLAELIPLVRSRRGLIVAGSRSVWSAADAEAIAELSAATGWPVIPAVNSGLPGGIRHVETMVRVSLLTGLEPEVVLHIGGILSSRRWYQWLSETPAFHLGLDRGGEVPNPYGLIDRQLVAEVAEAARQLAQHGTPAASSWSEQWVALDARIDRAVEATPDLSIVRAVGAAVNERRGLVVGSSMSVRELEWFGGAIAPFVWSNRGVNGIDGTIATSIGVARRVGVGMCLLGDLAFVYDLTSLIYAQALGVNLLVVVSDNAGGGIFHRLDQFRLLPTETFERLFGTPQPVHVCEAARGLGVYAAEVNTTEDWEHELGAFTQSGGVRVLRWPRPRVADLTPLDAALRT